MSIKIRNPKSEARNVSRFGFRASCFVLPAPRGYTLIELMVAVGLFAVIMLLASGAYFMMISANRKVQATVTGINNLAFALETMTRTIRTGTSYSCNEVGDCPPIGTSGNGGGTTFSVTNSNGDLVTYAHSVSGGIGTITQNDVPLTDASVNVTSLRFYVVGTGKPTDALPDYQQPRVTITASSTIPTLSGQTESFMVETGATMRGTDL